MLIAFHRLRLSKKGRIGCLLPSPRPLPHCHVSHCASSTSAGRAASTSKVDVTDVPLGVSHSARNRVATNADDSAEVLPADQEERGFCEYIRKSRGFEEKRKFLRKRRQPLRRRLLLQSRHRFRRRHRSKSRPASMRRQLRVLRC